VQIETDAVWAKELRIAKNVVRQLLVPAGLLQVVDTDADRFLENSFGRWLVTDNPGDHDQLTASLGRSGAEAVTWMGGRTLNSESDVLDSYYGAFDFRDPGLPGSLRRPQVGALHSILGHWHSGLEEAGIVVMPTGTGKTETMLALLVVARLPKVLVVVPTAALRTQIADKFQTLGVLQSAGIVTATALRPIVGRLEHGIVEPPDAEAFIGACNVVVTTPAALDACKPKARDVLYAGFSHLLVDEAHHSPAPSWSRIIDRFRPRPVLLFTATPFREDGRALPGRRIFRYPLRVAQEDGYFTEIDYRAVLSLEGNDSALADQALARLRSDIEAGHDHLLMARGKNIARAAELLALYEAKAADLNPTIIHYDLKSSERSAALNALLRRQSRVVVCVDMLGEGFDLPQLKVAAVHDAKQSLGPMLQFIGRFSRTAADQNIGSASVFVARDPAMALSPLRDLLREDPDWNFLLSDITDRATEAVEELNTFEESFSEVPEEVPVSLLKPKMSARAHIANSGAWTPENAVTLYGEDNLVGNTVSVGADSRIAWLVVTHNQEVRWGDLPHLDQLTYELIIMYFDQSRRLLYIYGSDNRGSYRELAEAVLGQDAATPIRGLQTFRVLSGVDRLIPTNVGLLDIRDHFSRFSMHVGSDVVEALNIAERQSKTQTHIATTGFENGEKTTISASLSGTFWSLRPAPNLMSWAAWCDRQGTKLLNNDVALDAIMDGFIIPTDLTDRPDAILLGLEWPWQIVGSLVAGPEVTYDNGTHPLLDIGFVVDDFGREGPFRFSLVTEDWKLAYSAEFEDQGLTYVPASADAEVATRAGSIPLAAWINRHKPTMFLDGDRMITADDRLLAPPHDVEPYDRSHLKALDWNGVDIQKESQRVERRGDSIQAYMSRYLQATQSFDVLLDDDRANEAADLVGLEIVGGELHITLVHCKFSTESTPGARVADLYELCGQAMRGAKWRQQGAQPLLFHLDRRARDYAATRGRSPFEIGDIEELFRIREVAPQMRPQFHTVIVQPGLSTAVSTPEQLRLIAGAHSYVQAITHGSFTVYCSA